MSSFCSHCGSALGWAITPIRAAAPEPPAPGVDLDPVLAKFYAVDNVPALIAAQSEHIEKLQDAARRNVKPWEDTFPPTLLPKYLRDNGLPDPVPPTVVVVQTAKFCPACGEATGNPDCFICTATPPAPSAGVSEPCYCRRCHANLGDENATPPATAPCAGVSVSEGEYQDGISAGQALATLSSCFASDPHFAWGWHCNLAMAAQDEGLDHAAANRAAARFMHAAFGIDTTQCNEYAALTAPSPPGGSGVTEVDCCSVAVAIAIKYVLDNVKQVEAIGQRLSAGPFAGGWSTACDEIIERLCDPSAPTARPAPADSALREVATTFLAAYEEQEDADWSPEWRALAERARHALSPVERGGEGRWFDPMSPKFDPGRVLVGLRPSKPVAPSPAAESDGRVGCAVCAMCGELLRAEYQLGPAQFGVGQRITPAEQMPVAWIGDAGLTLLEVQGRAMIFRSELKGSGNNERPLYFHPAPPAPSAGVSVSEGEYQDGISAGQALATLSSCFASDPHFAWGWHCNLAMAARDEGLDHSAANRAAARFMHAAFGIDTTQCDEYTPLTAAAQVRANDSGVG
jgi:hypothetical protein